MAGQNIDAYALSCGTELAREGAGTTAAFQRLERRLREQAHSHKVQRQPLDIDAGKT